MSSRTLDCRGMRHPMPIVNLARCMKTLDPGEDVELLADDPSCVQNLPDWCATTGNELVEFDTTDGPVRALIMRVGD